MKNKKFKADVEVDWIPFRQNLQTLLRSRGYTATDLARNVNMSPATITRYMYERTPDITAAWIIADYFNVSIDWLVGRTKNRYDTFPSEIQSLAEKYQAASESDRLIINTLLSKYEHE